MKIVNGFFDDTEKKEIIELAKDLNDKNDCVDSGTMQVQWADEEQDLIEVLLLRGFVRLSKNDRNKEAVSK